MQTSELYNIFLKHPNVTTDSRDCPEGSIFFALKGASFDGNRFAAAALDKGCAYAVVDEPEYAAPGDTRYIVVGDCLEAMRQLALYHRRQLGTPVIGITGTNGKTTTKELTAAVLSKRYNVLYTEGNFNNDIGVPKTLLRLTPRHDIAVVEMGASHPGDIRHLVEIVEPDYAVITNVGRAHLQGFGSFEGVVRTKGELYDFMRTRNDWGEPEARIIKPGMKRCVFIDNDNPHLTAMAAGLGLVRYGCNAAEGLWAEGRVESCDPALAFGWRHGAEHHSVQTHLIGAYNITNMLAAVSIGLYFGVDAALIDEALAGYQPSNNRSQFEQTADNRLIVDAYNANPTSMAAALDNFAAIHAEGKMAIIGDMKELGAVSHDEHQKIADRLAASDIPTVWLVGQEFEGCSVPPHFRLFDNVEQVEQAIAADKPRGRYILIKGSNGTRLFRLPPML